MTGPGDRNNSRSPRRRKPSLPPEAFRERSSFPILRIWEEGRENFGLELEVSEEFDQAYRSPGQYVTLRLPGMKARFFVIAARPERGRWEFLIDRDGGFGQALEGLKVGDLIEISLPEGPGFSLEEAVGKKALLFSTGSGVATVRSLLEAWLRRESSKRPEKIVLYHGEEAPGVGTYEALFAKWRREGVVIHRAFASGAEEEEGEVVSGFVQEAFQAHPEELEEVFVYLSGAAVMIDAVTELLTSRGLREERLKTNL